MATGTVATPARQPKTTVSSITRLGNVMSGWLSDAAADMHGVCAEGQPQDFQGVVLGLTSRVALNGQTLVVSGPLQQAGGITTTYEMAHDYGGEAVSVGHYDWILVENDRPWAALVPQSYASGEVFSLALAKAVDRAVWLAVESMCSVACAVGQSRRETDPENEDDWWVAIPLTCEGEVGEVLAAYRGLVDSFVSSVNEAGRRRIRFDLEIE